MFCWKWTLNFQAVKRKKINKSELHLIYKIYRKKKRKNRKITKLKKIISLKKVVLLEVDRLRIIMRQTMTHIKAKQHRFKQKTHQPRTPLKIWLKMATSLGYGYLL